MALGLCLLLAAPARAQAAAGLDRVFSDQVFYASTDLSRVPNWRDLLSRVGADRGAWLGATDALIGAAPDDQLRRVNALFNAAPYHADQVAWGMQDYWETPSQLLEQGGDCEDSAAAKYFALRRLGFPAGALRLTLVRDVLSGQFHAVLLVHLSGRTIMLDNRGDVSENLDGATRYVPILAMNEVAWWRV